MARYKPVLLLSVLVLAGHLNGQTKQSEKPWWLAKPLRLIQTNLREIDAIDFDVEKYAANLKDFGANAVLINVGGIVANYPTELEYHYRNPHLKSDMIGEVVNRLHNDGVRVFGRFDFSKVNETFAARRPEWLYHSIKGETVNYNGQVHTCVNGGYQQEYLFRILGEAIDKYPLDGIFFNMIGYHPRDYSGNYHGICQSDACRRRFREWSGGLNLPVKEDTTDPVFRRYQEFKRVTSDELFHRVNAFIKSKRSDIAICTYTDAGVDVIRMESGSELSGGVPAWEYHGSDNVKRALGSYSDKQVSNAAVSFLGIPYRHTLVSPALTELRLVQNMMNGGGLDFYMIGRLDNQEDRFALDAVREVFRFHQKHERFFTNVRSHGDVALIGGGPRAEFQGFLRILSANHILFDAMDRGRLTSRDTPRLLENYKVVILPDVANLSDAACKRLDDYVAGGGTVLATGYTSTRDELGNPLDRFRLQAAGVEPEYIVHQRARGTYVRIFPEDKKVLRNPSFERLDIVYVLGDFLEYKLKETATGHLGLIPPAMYGPPEKCYYTKVTDIPGLILNRHGEGRFAYFPWPVARHYDEMGHHGQAMLVMAAIHDLLGLRQNLAVDASPMVEVSRQESHDGTFGWIGLLNHAGQIGAAFHQPVPVRNIGIRVHEDKKIRSARLLHAGTSLKLNPAGDGWVALTVPELKSYEFILLEYR